MGVLVFLLSLLPLTGGSHVNLMKAESPGPQVDKLVPKVQSTAKILYGIYFAPDGAGIGVPAGRADAAVRLLATSFGTAGTGGFGFRNDSFASLSPYIQWVVTIFMILFGVNFNAYFLLLMRRFRRAAASEEVRAYFVIIGWLWHHHGQYLQHVQQALARRCATPPSRWAPSLPPQAFPAAILTCGPPSPRRSWSC